MTQTFLNKDLYDVLNAVALKKMASASAVADSTGQQIDDVADSFADLQERNLIALVGDTAMPTDGSAQVLIDSASQIYSDLRVDPNVLTVADKFEDVNSRFLKTMASWQQIEVGGRKLANDHTDADYDAKVIVTIEKLVARLEGLLQALAEKDPRFAHYINRFDRSVDKVDEGDISFVSDPTKDSVHNVWFEFHEDLLRTLGRARKE
ncbi:hypothetical protein EEB12_28445 [Rhodococcus sp. WS1]|uniref:hypothetical protein n=1 Tax=unclassified Rhodococcus (in: high G+C Gram-positive bacteria) TaxID=192944 RepID=UPI0011424608|nr:MULTISPECIES: hypothetical protein [unclassified Rhodococcus (in: high G+C Gram-positive bacteria)]ROZ52783.1 hypothetical protein EEB12_28445 [Rhodococcus sp. WS1]TQC34307.1 hypothetical protein EEB16_29430 [Rhodococcus sp. WS7]